MGILGSITLYHKESVISKMPYFNKDERTSILIIWRVGYENIWQDCYYEIYPKIADSDLDMVYIPTKKVLAEMKSKKVILRPKKIEKFVRPPAIYDNNLKGPYGEPIR